MTTLRCMRGYPGSGKSTQARELPGVVVGRDYLRHQMYGKYVLDGDGETAVTIAQQAQVKALLTAGRDVIVDDMNLNPRYLRDWAKLARDLGAEFFVYDVLSSPDECVERDDNFGRRMEGKQVGEDVIRKIAKRWPMQKWPNIVLKSKPTTDLIPYVAKPNTPPAILVDIDGTLAHLVDRSPFDYSQVHTDTVDETIRDLVNHEWAKGTIVIICSGRDGSCAEQTAKWLVDNGVAHDRLFMRNEDSTDDDGNKLPDWIVKAEIFNANIRDSYDVKYVLDDRQQVVDMWRALGLKCLQVEPGDF